MADALEIQEVCPTSTPKSYHLKIFLSPPQLDFRSSHTNSGTTPPVLSKRSAMLGTWKTSTLMLPPGAQGMRSVTFRPGKGEKPDVSATSPPAGVDFRSGSNWLYSTFIVMPQRFRVVCHDWTLDLRSPNSDTRLKTRSVSFSAPSPDASFSLVTCGINCEGIERKIGMFKHGSASPKGKAIGPTDPEVGQAACKCLPRPRQEGAAR